MTRFFDLVFMKNFQNGCHNSEFYRFVFQNKTPQKSVSISENKELKYQKVYEVYEKSMEELGGLTKDVFAKSIDFQELTVGKDGNSLSAVLYKAFNEGDSNLPKTAMVLKTLEKQYGAKVIDIVWPGDKISIQGGKIVIERKGKSILESDLVAQMKIPKEEQKNLSEQNTGVENNNEITVATNPELRSEEPLIELKSKKDGVIKNETLGNTPVSESINKKEVKPNGYVVSQKVLAEIKMKSHELTDLSSVESSEYSRGIVKIKLSDGAIVKTKTPVKSMEVSGKKRKKVEVVGGNGETGYIVLSEKGVLDMDGGVFEIDPPKLEPLKQEEIVTANEILIESGIRARIEKTPEGYIKFTGDMAELFKNNKEENPEGKELILKRPMSSLKINQKKSGKVILDMKSVDGVRYSFLIKEDASAEPGRQFNTLLKSRDTDESVQELLKSKEEVRKELQDLADSAWYLDDISFGEYGELQFKGEFADKIKEQTGFSFETPTPVYDLQVAKIQNGIQLQYDNGHADRIYKFVESSPGVVEFFINDKKNFEYRKQSLVEEQLQTPTVSEKEESITSVSEKSEKIDVSDLEGQLKYGNDISGNFDWVESFSFEKKRLIVSGEIAKKFPETGIYSADKIKTLEFSELSNGVKIILNNDQVWILSKKSDGNLSFLVNGEEKITP